VFLAVGAIVWAGLKYAMAAGNPGTQSDARDQILQALLGLLLLFGAYVILYTINPNLVNLQPLTLDAVTGTKYAVPGAGTDVTLPADIQAEINPNVTIVFERTISSASQFASLRKDCLSQTNNKGVIGQKTVPGSSNLVYVCEMPPTNAYSE